MIAAGLLAGALATDAKLTDAAVTILIALTASRLGDAVANGITDEVFADGCAIFVPGAAARRGGRDASTALAALVGCAVAVLAAGAWRGAEARRTRRASGTIAVCGTHDLRPGGDALFGRTHAVLLAHPASAKEIDAIAVDLALTKAQDRDTAGASSEDQSQEQSPI